MPITPYGGAFEAIADATLGGKGHEERIGDSQTTNGLDYVWGETWVRACRKDYDYFVCPAVSASTSLASNLGYGATLSDCGAAVGDTNYNIAKTILSYGPDVATVCPVTTTANHEMETGDNITILTATGGTDIAGSYTITKTGAATFTIVKACASPGSGGTMRHDCSLRILAPARISHPAAGIADSANFGSGIYLARQVSSTPAHTNAQRSAAWPGLPANGGEPWFHKRLKAKLVYWVATTNNLDQFNVNLYREGHTTANAQTGTSAAHTNTADPDHISASAWTPGLTCIGSPIAITSNSAASPTVVTTATPHGLASNDIVTIRGQSGTVDINGTNTATVTGASTFTIAVNCVAGGGTGGTVRARHHDIHANGVGNDHQVALRLNGKAGYTETNKTIIPLAAVFAECDASDVLPAPNADGSYNAYSFIGRSGAYVSSWVNYCTYTDWFEWFQNTILGTSPTFIDCYMLGHNLSPSAIACLDDDGQQDGYGAQAEMTDGLPNAFFKSRYKELIRRRREAFLAAFPTGRYVGPLIVVPWAVPVSNGMDITQPARIAAMNSVMKEIAVESGGGWFSYVDYYTDSAGNYQTPLTTLHPFTPEQGRELAQAHLMAMHRATNFRYSELGSVAATSYRNRAG